MYVTTMIYMVDSGNLVGHLSLEGQQSLSDLLPTESAGAYADVPELNGAGMFVPKQPQTQLVYHQ